MILKIFHIGISGNEPQKFIYDLLQMYLLGGEKRKTFAEGKAHLVAEYALRSGTGAV